MPKYPNSKKTGKKLFPDSDVKKDEIPGRIWEDLKGIGRMFLNTGAKGVSAALKKKKKYPKAETVYGTGRQGKKVALNF